MTSLAPTLADLQSLLAREENELTCADIGISDSRRREAKMAQHEAGIRDLKRKIALMGGSAVRA